MCINTDNVLPNTIKIGVDYKLIEKWKNSGCYVVIIAENEINVSLKNFETLNNRLLRLSKTSDKTIVTKPGGKYTKYTVELIATDNYIIVYSHSRGNSYNISGNHHKYYHDENTGEFLNESLVNNEPSLYKEKFLLSDFNAIHSVLAKKQIPNTKKYTK